MEVCVRARVGVWVGCENACMTVEFERVAGRTRASARASTRASLSRLQVTGVKENIDS